MADDPDFTDITDKVLQDEVEHVASHTGRSQYGPDGGGASSCGLAALNCARIVLQREKDGLQGPDLIQAMMRRDMFEDILAICSQWSSSAHLDVDDIYNAPIFAANLTLIWSEYEQPGFKQFQDLLARLQQVSGSSGALILTRPPEIISVLNIHTDSKPVIVTFDSHPRSKHPDGAAFVFHPTLDAAASYLSDLLQFDRQLLADPSLQWQAQLLAHYSAHMFVAKDLPSSSSEFLDTLVAASLEVLALKAEITDLKSRNRMLESDTKHLTAENAQLEARIEDLEEDNRRHIRRATLSGPTPGVKSSSPSTAPRQNPGPSNSITQSVASSSSSKGTLIFRTTELEEDDELFATRIQLEWQEQVDDGAKFAFQRQKEYEEEDELLRSQFESLKQVVPASFKCGICLEEETEFMIARIDPCGHSFCRLVHFP
ncbi:hypothetical protein EW026_g5570 [Hermanssonia centrifuga]|uniref:Uncharacterized protein n=1 Tax=Hermanssonia centrifuga TaxID=98765 RepID=A0A4S4KDR9_9APHY|nr:hypothetical protein EW026_g5570 [Hermanssonia centrifuga]